MGTKIKVVVGIIIFLIIVTVLANITGGSDSVNQAPVANPNTELAQEFNWWMLFPFGVAALMIYIIFFTKPKALSLGAVLILVGTSVFFYFNYHWFVPGLNIVNEKLGQPSVSSTPVASSAKQMDAAIQPESKIVVAANDGKAVLSKKTAEKNVSACTEEISTLSFSPGTETFIKKPLLATAGPGEYLLKVKGTRKQWFLVNGKVSYSRTVDADGNLLDESPVKQWVTDAAMFKSKPYGGVTLQKNAKMVYAGSNYRFKLDQDDTKLYLDINVFQHPDNYTSTDSTMKATLFKCS
ncbi:MAG: hypothetical protein PHT88_03315 [Candidatus Moranbacteria bacterium]|nr:hypothetical protein [Candidatus Moranbacteria bacterium]